jgi:hypothetical protein
MPDVNVLAALPLPGKLPDHLGALGRTATLNANKLLPPPTAYRRAAFRQVSKPSPFTLAAHTRAGNVERAYGCEMPSDDEKTESGLPGSAGPIRMKLLVPDHL